MRIVIQWNARPRGADVAFFALAGLAATILGMLTGSLMEQASHYAAQVAAACESAWAILRSQALTGPALLPASILTVILCTGGLALLRQFCATHRLVSTARRRRIAPSDRLLRSAGPLGLADRVDLIADERLYSFCYGLLSPRICLTTGLLELLDDDELDALLLHERYHVQCRDPLKALLSGTWAAGLFFLPLAQDLRNRYLRAKEIEADDAAALTDEGQRQMPLASALLKVLTSEQRLRHQSLAPIALQSSAMGAIGAFSMSVTEERIERLINHQAHRSPRLVRPTRALVSALVVSLIVVASFRPFVVRSPVESHNECANLTSYSTGD